MSGSIMGAIFGKGSAQASASPTAAPSAPPAQTVDVAAIVDKAAAAKGEKLAWRTSIVDLMKALDLDSSLSARKQLAKELHYTGNPKDSAKMNVWLHKQIMIKLAANGGKLPVISKPNLQSERVREPSGHGWRKTACPLYPKSGHVRALAHVRFGPKAGISHNPTCSGTQRCWPMVQLRVESAP